MLSKDMKDLLRTLNEYGVKYLIVGGYAFGVHVEPRATKDLDLFIKTDVENSEALYSALAKFGAPLAELSPVDFRDGSTFQMGQPPERVDILQKIDGISFEEAWEHRVSDRLDGEIPTDVISKEDLIRNKLASGREQDLLDVKRLVK